MIKKISAIDPPAKARGILAKIGKKRFISSKAFYNLPIEDMVKVFNELPINKKISGLKTIFKKRNEQHLFDLYLSVDLNIEDEVFLECIIYIWLKMNYQREKLYYL
jgi:hypothetical protein